MRNRRIAAAVLSMALVLPVAQPMIAPAASAQTKQLNEVPAEFVVGQKVEFPLAAEELNDVTLFRVTGNRGINAILQAFREKNFSTGVVAGAVSPVRATGSESIISVRIEEGTEPGPVALVWREGGNLKYKQANIVADPRSASARYTPHYNNADIKLGAKDTVNPWDGTVKPAALTGASIQGAAPKAWGAELDSKDGRLTVTGPSVEKLAAEFEKQFPQGVEATNWEEYVAKLKPFAEPTVEVRFEYADNTSNLATAQFRLIGEDYRPLLDKDGMFDGKTKNSKLVDDMTNPFKPVKQLRPNVPTILMEKVPNPTPDHTGTVKQDGKSIGKVTIDSEKGDIAVTIDPDAEGRAVVEVLDGKGNRAIGNIGIDVTQAVKKTLSGTPTATLNAENITGFVGRAINPVELHVDAQSKNGKLENVQGPEWLKVQEKQPGVYVFTGTPTTPGPSEVTFDIVDGGERNSQEIDIQIGTANLYAGTQDDNDKNAPQPQQGSSDPAKTAAIVVGVIAAIGILLGGIAFAFPQEVDRLLKQFLP